MNMDRLDREWHLNSRILLEAIIMIMLLREGSRFVILLKRGEYELLYEDTYVLSGLLLIKSPEKGVMFYPLPFLYHAEVMGRSLLRKVRGKT